MLLRVKETHILTDKSASREPLLSIAAGPRDEKEGRLSPPVRTEKGARKGSFSLAFRRRSRAYCTVHDLSQFATFFVAKHRFVI